MKKKILALAMAAIMLIVAVVGGTLAYFTDDVAETNTFIIGNIDIELYEKHQNQTEYDNGVYHEWLGEQRILPDVPVDKIVTVKNVGGNKAYVRVTVTVPADMTPIWAEKYNGWVPYDTNPESGAGEYRFYYPDVLDPEVETPALLEAMKLNADVTDVTASDAYDVHVYAEAIQADSFADAEAAMAALDEQIGKVFGEGITVVATAIDLNTALEDGKSVTLGTHITNSSNTVLNGGTIDGQGYELYKSNPNKVSSSYNNAGIRPTAGTIKNITIKGEEAWVEGDTTPKSFRAVYAATLTGDLTIENSNLIGPAYAFNAGGLGGNTLTVKDTVIEGWVSYGTAGGAGEAVFTNVEFITGESMADYYGWDLRLLRTYGNKTTLTNCHFAEGYRFDTAGADNEIVFNDCRVGDAVITPDNVASFFDLANTGVVTAIVNGTTVTING